MISQQINNENIFKMATKSKLDRNVLHMIPKTILPIADYVLKIPQ
jgi:hypothetical protein